MFSSLFVHELFKIPKPRKSVKVFRGAIGPKLSVECGEVRFAPEMVTVHATNKQDFFYNNLTNVI